MPLPNREDEARLAVLLAAMLYGVEAKNSITKAAILFTDAAKQSRKQDQDQLVAHVDESIRKLEGAIAEARLFRNMVRDDRSPGIRNAAQRVRGDAYAQSRLPKHHQDPNDVIQRYLNAGKNDDK